MTPDLLFVFGTLLSGYDHPMSKMLSERAELLGGARCTGQLYRVNDYASLRRLRHRAQPNIHLALDKTPFFARAQLRNQLVERRAVLRRELEPGEEVERLAEIARMIKLAGDRGDVLHAVFDVARF